MSYNIENVKPGTVAMVRREDGTEVMALKPADAYAGWACVESNGSLLTDEFRPLVVLDAESDRDHAAFLKAWDDAFRITPGMSRGLVMIVALRTLAAQQSTPPLKEPGLWGVVTADYDFGDSKDIGITFIRTDAGWCNFVHGWVTDWERLIRPTLIREGVES